MIAAIVQSRMRSSRLPGKSLSDICGHPMLWHVVNRIGRSRFVEKTIVATSTESFDDPIAHFCDQESIDCFRGREDDVLDRFYQAARRYSVDTVVRITADCPLVDPAVIDRVIGAFQAGRVDYASNTIRYTYPDGLDVEVFSFGALEQAWREATKPSEREHVTPYLRSGKFRIANVEREGAVSGGQHRWTVDYATDLQFVRNTYSAFSSKLDFEFEDILQLLEQRPELLATHGVSISNEGYYRSLFDEAVAGPAPKLPLKNSQKWLSRSRSIIPGSSQTFSKGPKQYVQGAAPIFLERGKGCRVWDVDGNEYIDYVQGLLPNILGYANHEVNQAVCEQLAKGHCFSLPHPIEVELAERLTRLIPCAEMVRFGKNGSDATSGAVRAARAFTGRERIACCGYHGWQDWYIGSTSRNAGVPKAVASLTHSFAYNDLLSLQTLFADHPGEFAAVIMEPINFTEPAPGFLAAVKELAHQHGALLIFDEICSGFHFGLGGAQKLFGVIPDLACFGKAMGNGFPISCVVGRADVMQIFEEIFYSFTFAGETASMAAAMKVLDILENTDALVCIEANGRTLKDGLTCLAKEAGLANRLKCIGRPTWSLLKFLEADDAESVVLKNLFQQEAVKRGVLLLTTHNLSAALDNAAVHKTLEVYAAVIKTLAMWLEDSNPVRFLEGQMSEPVFRVR